MGQITIRELENIDFFKEIPKDILQNLLNESNKETEEKCLPCIKSPWAYGFQSACSGRLL